MYDFPVFFIYFTGDYMYLIAHRGNNNHKYKENSKQAFINCFNTSYIDGIELDIRLTKDNIIVVSHNDLVNGKLIDKCNYNKIKKDVDKLENILESLSDKKKIVIDVKEDNKKIVDILCSLLNNYKYNFYICSFNDDIVNLIKQKYPTYKVGLIIGYMINIDKIYNKLDFNSLQYNLINRINNKKEIFIWTVNDKKILNKIKKHGNNFNIITDKSYLLK